MVPWDDKLPKFSYSPRGEASALFVPTVETTRLSYFLDSLLANRY
jgi:dynein heavy chain